MSKKAPATCADCYFQRAGLCALVLERPCPTFRVHTKGALSPPGQAPLVMRPVLGRVAHAA